MKQSRLVGSHVIALVKQVEGRMRVSYLRPQHGTNSAWISKGRCNVGGLGAYVASQFKELQEEKRRLKRSMPRKS